MFGVALAKCSKLRPCSAKGIGKKLESAAGSASDIMCDIEEIRYRKYDDGASSGSIGESDGHV